MKITDKITWNRFFSQNVMHFVRWFRAFCFAFLLAAKVDAQSVNKKLILPGARAQALAGAFTGLADDASAGWYNPAGLAQVSGPGVSVSVNSYTSSKKEVSNAIDEIGLSENSQSLYPGFAGGYVPLGPIVFGWSYFTLEKQDTDESRRFDVPATESHSAFIYHRKELTSGSLIHAGGSIALKLGSRFSLGFSEFYYQRQKQTSLKERSVFPSGAFSDSHLRQSTKNEGMLSVYGFHLKWPYLSLGFSAKMPKALSNQTQREIQSVSYVGASTAPELAEFDGASHYEDEVEVPTYTFGLGFTPFQYLLLTADVSHYPAVKSKFSDVGGISTRAVTDGAVGVEVSAWRLFAGAGTFLNTSLVEKPDPSSSGMQPAQINYKGISSGFGYRSKASETMVIYVRQTGKGVTHLIDSVDSLQTVWHTFETLSVSSKYQF